MRKAINAMQRDSINGVLTIRDHVELAVDISNDIVNHIISKKSTTLLRQMILDRSSEFNNDYILLLGGIFDEIYKSKLDDDTKRLFMIELSDGMYRHESVMDKEINAYSTLLRLY
jgi:hypothetical protein